MITPIQNLTIEQLQKAADDFAGKYIPMNQKVARAAFMEAVLWAQKVNEKKIEL